MVKKKEKKVSVKTKKSKKIPTKKPSKPIVWRPLDLLTNMDRFFMDDPWVTSLWGSWPYIPWSERWNEPDMKISPLDLVDTGNKYKIITEVPGVSKKDLDVNIIPSGIRICGETKNEEGVEGEGYVRRERRYSTICRNIAFPEEVNPDKANATLEDGILEVTVSKKSPTKSRQVYIK
ncbi:MAG: Hsp20/alpha crystallin family protein [Thermoplasmatales archaeon]|nr:MAG: Hsp20/alpha crystallin family protein [Thermoplasmatales archaeon]